MKLSDPVELRFLLTIKECGSLRAAAQRLELTPSAVTQRLQLIEKKLGIHLIDRSARRLRLTEEGELLCGRGAGILDQFDALMEELQARRDHKVGALRINAPFGFGRRHVAAATAEFQEHYPDVDITLTLSESPHIEKHERYDVVVHIGQLALSNMVGHALAPNARWLCAAPELIARHGMPGHPDELAALPCLTLRENNEDFSLWSFSKGGARSSVRVRSRLICNDGDTVRRWALEGRGIILRSEWDVADDLRAGHLLRLLPQWKVPDAPVIALTHQRTGLPVRTRLYLRHLQERFRPAPPWRRLEAATAS